MNQRLFSPGRISFRSLKDENEGKVEMSKMECFRGKRKKEILSDDGSPLFLENLGGKDKGV